MEEEVLYTGYATHDYDLVHTLEGDKTVYQVVNRSFKVVEYIDHLLPRTINTMLELQSELDKADKAIEVPVLTLVEMNDGEGEDGIH